MNFKKYVSETIHLQSEMVEKMDEVKLRIRILNKELKQLVHEKLNTYFPSHTFDTLTSLDGGCMVKTWDPSIVIMGVDKLTWTDQNYWINDKQEKVQPTINIQELNYFLNTLSEEIGLPCRVHEKHIPVKEEITRIRNVEDLKLKYEGIDIIYTGKVYYKGWDIPDIFFITIYDWKYMIFYSENSHGFGIDNIITENNSVQELDKFFEFAKEDHPQLKNTYYEIILKSWDKN